MYLGIVTLVFLLLAIPVGADAQSAKVPRIGILSPGSAGPSPLLAAFEESLRGLGYIDKQNILLEYRFADTSLDRLPALAAELIALRVDVILAINNTASQAALNATRVIPIVFTWVADPAPLVGNLARPERNATGLTSVAAELSGKRLQLLKDILPGVSRMAVLWNSSNPMATRMVREMEGAGRRLDVQLHAVGVRGSDELQDVFRSVARGQAGALFVIEEATLLPHRARILSLAAQHRLPAASQYRSFAEAGGLLSYGADLPDLFRRAAFHVDKILRGAQPADLPVEQPTKFELVINLKTAKALGLTIPPSLLLAADRVIE
ncbi:MAG TPA: ABC transporter substrate-binding protein [Methylomirabilota bacterium]